MGQLGTACLISVQGVFNQQFLCGVFFIFVCAL
jgi:hypothetical protein